MAFKLPELKFGKSKLQKQNKQTDPAKASALATAKPKAANPAMHSTLVIRGATTVMENAKQELLRESLNK